MYSHTDLLIHLFSINGLLLKSIDACDRVNCITVYEGKYLIYGTEKGFVVVRKLWDLSQVGRYDVKQAEPVSTPAKDTSFYRPAVVPSGPGTAVRCVAIA